MVQKKRLAETFVEEGIITEVQLRNALQRQLVMGGKIGTNLIELKYVSEEQLGKVLSKMHKIPYAPVDAFLDIPADIISLIPKEIAVRHKIIPIKKEYKNITLAMENPNDIKIIDDLSFMTGCRITAVIASEVRIALGLEKYYGHPRGMRYIEITPPKEEEFVIERNLTHTEPTPACEKKEVKPSEKSEWLSDAEEEEPAYVFQSRSAEEHPTAEKQGSPATQLTEAVSRPVSFQDTVNKLTNVDTRDNAIKAVLDYISQYVENVLFLVTSVSEAKAWNAKCKGVEYSRISDLKISFGGPSVFLTVKNSEQPYYGEITSFPFDDDFLGKIGQKRPMRVFLIPIMVKKKMVSILYIDNNNKDISPAKLTEINSIIEKLSIAFELLVLKKKTESKP